MTTHVPLATPDQTIGEVQECIREHMRGIETVNYVYVVDDQRTLVGVLSVKDLFRHHATVKVRDIWKTHPLVTVRPASHQERVASLALQHNIKAVPVVDHDHRMLGVIPSDAILSILRKESHEDLLRLGGVHHRGAFVDNILNLSLLQSLTHRLPWLIVGLFGGIAAAKLISGYEATLQEELLLAAFLPLIVYMSSAVGTQMQAFIIRDLSIDRQLPFAKYFFRQTGVVFFIAVFTAGLLFATTLFLHGNTQLSGVLAVSLVASVLSSLLTGLLIPYGFSRVQMDPANASGPVSTIVQDLLSILIYFTVATSLL